MTTFQLICYFLIAANIVMAIGGRGIGRYLALAAIGVLVAALIANRKRGT